MRTLAQYPAVARCWPILGWIGVAGLITIYVVIVAYFGALFLPFYILGLLPVLALIPWLAPDLPGVPRRWTISLILIGAFIMPLWPVYLHIKLGPLPILTPTRLLFYAISAIWLYEMSCVPWRRAQFIAAARRLAPLFIIVCLLFLQKLISVPFAAGSAIAGKEFFRQSVIWLVPFLAVVTYVHRRRDLHQMVMWFVIASGIAALIAIGEFASGRLLAEVLSPIMGHQEWLSNVLADKARSGTFRAQATHTHPLSLGEQLAMAIPFALYLLIRPGRSWRRLAWITILGVLLLGVVATNSRGALIAGVVAFGIAFFLMLFSILRKPKAVFIRPLAGLILAGSVICAPIVGGGLYSLAKGQEGTIEEESSQARIDQFTHAIPKITARPLNGYGNGRATRILGYYTVLLTIDNYYLNLVLDLGIPGVTLFFLQFVLIGWFGGRWGQCLWNDPYASLYSAFAAMAVAFALMRSVLSITINIETLMVLMAAFIGAAAVPRRAMRRRANAAPALPSASTALRNRLDLFEQHRRQVLHGTQTL